MFRHKKKKKRAPYLRPFPANWFVISLLVFACLLTIVGTTVFMGQAAVKGEILDEGATSLERWLSDIEWLGLMCCCSLPFVWAVAILSVIFRLGGTTIDRREVAKRGQEIF